MDSVRTSQTEVAQGGGKEDRRSHRRYLIALNLRWGRINGARRMDSGTGKTVDLSSDGLLFEAGRDLRIGESLELSISWPVLLRNVAPLQLKVLGDVVRVVGRHVAIRIRQHEFRTVGIPLERRPRSAGPASGIPSLRDVLG